MPYDAYMNQNIINMQKHYLLINIFNEMKRTFYKQELKGILKFLLEHPSSELSFLNDNSLLLILN